MQPSAVEKARWKQKVTNISSQALWPWIVATYLPHQPLFCLWAFSIHSKSFTFALQLLRVWFHSPLLLDPTVPIHISTPLPPPTSVSPLSWPLASCCVGWRGRGDYRQEADRACWTPLPPCWAAASTRYRAGCHSERTMRSESERGGGGSSWNRLTMWRGQVLCDPLKIYRSVWYSYLYRWRTWTLQRLTPLCSRIWTPAWQLQKRQKKITLYK